LQGLPKLVTPKESVVGALIDYICHSAGAYFAPMNANWALFPSSQKETREETVLKALAAIDNYRKVIA
jgi:folate-dependent tRNA-U54 methylase TrmFO/GidA